MKKLFLAFLIFLNIPAVVYANEGIRETKIWKDMVQGKFVPISALSLKLPVRAPEIWENDEGLYRFVTA